MPRRANGNRGNGKAVIVVFCEGESEQAYTEYLKKRFADVAVIKYPKETGLFERAESRFAKDPQYRDYAEVTDEVWFFFDVETKDVDLWNQRMKIIKKLRKLRKDPNIRVRLLMTTGCVEYWFMLHFKMYAPPLQTVAEKERVISELLEKEPGYKKGDYPSTARIAENYPTAITIVPADQRVYVDTENAELHPLQMEDAEGYWFTREDTNFVCFAKEGCQFSLSGSLDIDEMLKVAAGIQAREGAHVQPTRPNTGNENAAPVVEYDKSLMEMEDALQARVDNLDWVRCALVTLSSADDGQIIEVDIMVDADILDDARLNALCLLALQEVPGLKRNMIYIYDWEGRTVD